MIATREVRKKAAHGNGAEIWFADLAQCGSALEAIEAKTPRLSDEDLQRFQQTQGAGEQNWRRRAHIALRIIIERAFGREWRQVPFAFGETGKPTLPHCPGDFSLAHTGNFALIGTNWGGRIGVDLEQPRKILIAPNRQQAIVAAATRLAPAKAMPDDERRKFIQAWVRLEALAKADGRGVGHVLTVLGARSPEQVPSTNKIPQDLPYTVVDLAIDPNFFAAAALGGTSDTTIAVTRFPDDVGGLAAMCEQETFSQKSEDNHAAR